MIKPAINHIYGLNPKMMQWIYKQVLLPRLTYGCHVWGHSLNQTQTSLLGSVERLALAYYAPMWRTTPTASLQIILNHNSAHISMTRNMHISNLISTLHRIKDKTGLYIIITTSKYDCLEYAGGNTTYEDLFVTPN